MSFKKLVLINAAVIFLFAVHFTSCSKNSASPGPTPADLCSGKMIVVSANSMPASQCSGPGGSIAVSATGSTGFTYKLNSNGTYQTSGLFENVSAGYYTVFAKDGEGCEKSATVTVNTSGTAGPLFTAVKNLMIAKCVSCHNNNVQNGSMNLMVDCDIVAFKDRIKIRAVDMGTMPPGGALTYAQKDVIGNWINAGGKLSD